METTIIQNNTDLELINVMLGLIPIISFNAKKDLFFKNDEKLYKVTIGSIEEAIVYTIEECLDCKGKKVPYYHLENLSKK